MMRILSLGAGIQSSALALLIAEGRLDPVECAIFADTGAEPTPVYEWLDELEGMLPFLVHRVIERDGLLKNIKKATKGGRLAGPPFFTESSNGGGMLRRQCTSEFKLKPIRNKVRELIGLNKGQRGPKEVAVEQLIGISTDEAVRMKDSGSRWIRNIYPLIDMGWSRRDCEKYLMDRVGKLPPKSACTFCPYHDNRYWRWLRDSDPAGWQQAVDIDTLIRDGVRGTTERLYLHSSMMPLEQVDLSTEEERGQLNMFENECEGMCGV